MQKISPFIWFDSNAEEAMNFYLPIFKDSKVIRVARNPPGAPGPEGALLVASIRLYWQVTPIMLTQLLSDPDRAKAGRVMQAMMKMIKLDIGALKAAADAK